jgi:hypothetical protein
MMYLEMLSIDILLHTQKILFGIILLDELILSLFVAACNVLEPTIDCISVASLESDECIRLSK